MSDTGIQVEPVEGDPFGEAGGWNSLVAAATPAVQRMTAGRQPGVFYGSVLPFSNTPGVGDQFDPINAGPIGTVKEIYNKFGDMLSGKTQPYAIDPETGKVVPNPEYIKNATDVAGMVAGSGMKVPVQKEVPLNLGKLSVNPEILRAGGLPKPAQAIGYTSKVGGELPATAPTTILPEGPLTRLPDQTEKQGLAYVPEIDPTARYVWHGTQANDIDQFSIDKVGSGEGNQVFGHGMYFAQRPGIGSNYRTAGASSVPTVAHWTHPDFTGPLLPDKIYPGQISWTSSTYNADHPLAGTHGDPSYIAAQEHVRNLAAYGDNAYEVSKANLGAKAQDAFDQYQDALSSVESWKRIAQKSQDDPDTFARYSNRAKMAEKDATAAQGYYQVKQDAVDWLDANHDKFTYVPAQKNYGSLYKVAMNADQNKMFDLEETLDKQPKEVQNAIENIPQSVKDEVSAMTSAHDMNDPWETPDAYSGHDLLSLLKQTDTWGHEYNQRSASPAISQHLESYGVPGIKYLDASSRGFPKNSPKATRNFVIFDPSQMEIVGKNGVQWKTERVDHDPFSEK